MKRSLLSAAALLCVCAVQPAHAALQFVDWTSVNTATDVALGSVGPVGVTLTGTVINGGVVNGTSTFFASPALFTPAIPSGDSIELGSVPSTSTFTITFAQAVVDPIVHLADFSSTAVFPGLTPIKISGNSFLTVTGDTVTAPPTGGAQTGAGTLQFLGIFNAIGFTATSATEGFYIQVGFDPLAPVPEPATIALMLAGLTALSWRVRASMN